MDSNNLQPTSTSQIVIVGPGAMGCLHAALLGRVPGRKVSLLDHRSDRAELIDKQGIVVEAPEGTHTIPVRCSAQPAELGVADTLIILTKAYDTEAAIQHALPLVGASTAVLTLQNGLGNYQILQQYVPAEQVLAGTTSSGATLLGPGHIRQAGLGDVVLGSPTNNTDLVQRVAALFETAALPTQVTDDLDGLLWRKVLINCAINPLTALTRRRNGQLLEVKTLHELMGQVAQEVYQVGAAAGIDWGDFALVAAVEEVCRTTAANQSSMLQDVLAGRRTEIDYITGAVVQTAKEYSADAALCRCLTALVKGLTQSNSED